MFAVTKMNSPLGKVLWYDGEFYHSHTVNNETYSLFVQVSTRQRPLRRQSEMGTESVCVQQTADDGE